MVVSGFVGSATSLDASGDLPQQLHVAFSGFDA